MKKHTALYRLSYRFVFSNPISIGKIRSNVICMRKAAYTEQSPDLRIEAPPLKRGLALAKQGHKAPHQLIV